MLEAKLSEKLPGSRVRCHTCQWRCAIAPGKSGLEEQLEVLQREVDEGQQ